MRWGAAAVAAACLAGSACAQAATPDECVITIVKVELKDNSGRWVELVRPDRQVDLAAETPRISFFNNAGRVPPGDYVNFRITLSETFGIAGEDGNHRTAAGGRAVLRGDAATGAELPGRITAWVERAPTWTPYTKGRMTQQIDLDGGDEDDVITITKTVDLASPLAIRAGTFVGVWFHLELEDTLRHVWPGILTDQMTVANAMCFFPPAGPEEVTILIDQTAVRIPGDKLTMEF